MGLDSHVLTPRQIPHLATARHFSRSFSLLRYRGAKARCQYAMSPRLTKDGLCRAADAAARPVTLQGILLHDASKDEADDGKQIKIVIFFTVL